MPEDENPPKSRPATGSTITVRIEVTDREEGTFTDVEAAVAEVTERVAQSTTGDRYDTVLPHVESIAREAINKTLAQLVANEARLAARES